MLLHSLIWPGLFIGLYLTSLYSYLLFHSLAEMFSIAVSFAVFMMAWNSRRFIGNGYLLFIGIALLYCAGIDILHTLAYKGMSIFQGFDANLPTQLWIGSQYLRSLSYLAAILFVARRFNVGAVMAGYAAVFALLVASIFYWKVFPVCYVEGAGLTPFKITSEYVISLFYVLSVILLSRHRHSFDRQVFHLLALSLGVSIISEIFFTQYVSVYGISNLVGHYFKIISFYLLYRAVIVTGFVNPYNLLFRELKQSEERLHRAVVDAPFPVMIHAEDGEILMVNTIWQELSGYGKSEIPSVHDWAESVFGERKEEICAVICPHYDRPERIKGGEHVLRTKDGNDIIWDFHTAPMGKLPDGRHVVITMAVDMTERMIAEELREKLISELQQALANVKTLSGLLPVCAWCRKVRDDQGYWTQLEAYVRDHSDADFSHGICPTCAAKEFPQHMERRRRQRTDSETDGHS